MSMLNNLGLGNLMKSCNSTISSNMQFINGIQHQLESGTPTFTGNAQTTPGAPPRLLQYMNQYPYLSGQINSGINFNGLA